MNINTQSQKSGLKKLSLSKPVVEGTASGSSEPSEKVTLGAKKDERGGVGTMLKRGVQWAAFMGVPAALGAAGEQIGSMADDKMGSLLGSIVGGGLGQGYGLVHGGYAGWHATPGKEQGGIMLAALTVPAGAVIGTLAATGLSVAGAAGGWPVAAGLAGAGFVIGMVHGHQDPKPGNW